MNVPIKPSIPPPILPREIQPAPQSSKSSTSPQTASLKGKEKSTAQGNGSEGDEEDDIAVDEVGGAATGSASNEKKTRGTKACTVCRKVKMRCIIAEEGLPCQRCRSGGHECIFQESMRGRRANRKTDMMAKSLKKMEATLESVLKTMTHPGSLPPSHPPLLSSSSFTSSQFAGPSAPYAQSTSTSSIPTSTPLTQALPLPPQSATAAPVPFFSGPLSSYTPPSPSMAVPQSDLVDDEPEELQTTDGDGRNPILHSLPADSLNPLGLLAEASLFKHRKRPFTLTEVLDHATDDLSDDQPPIKNRKIGVANTRYFQPGAASYLAMRRTVIEQKLPLTLLVDKYITVEEAVELFDLYYANCHLVCPILNPELHTPTEASNRSPFLFTAIITVASRYYMKRPDLYRKCLKVVRKAATDILGRGFKSTEICQGFLLMCHWNPPADRFEQDRVYQLAGIAIRMAADLNLNRKSTDSLPEDADEEVRYTYTREILNRERCWIYAFICDRRLACQMGKMHCIPREDPIIHGAKAWCRQPNSQKTDVGLCAILDLHRVVSRILEMIYSNGDSANALNTTLAYSVLLPSFLNQLDRWKDEWSEPPPPEPTTSMASTYTTGVKDFYHSYYRLFVLSFAVQHAMVSDADIELPKYCAWAFQAAANIIHILRDQLGPNGYFRYASDSSFVFVSYACTFLLKLVQVTATHSTFIDTEKAIELIEQGAAALDSVAVDDTHTPALYASFIRALLDNKRDGRSMPGSRAVTRPGSRAVTRPGSPVLAPMNTLDELGQPTIGLDGYLGGLFGDQFENFGSEPAVDTFEMDTEGFWSSSSVLFPGFNPDALQGLSGGTLSLDPWVTEPFHSSRAGSPSAGNGFDFHI